MPPRTDLWRLGKSAMDGAFSPFATGCRVGAPRLEQVSSRLARKAASAGRVLLVTFIARARKVTRPLPRSLATEFLRQNGRNSPQSAQGRWHCFSRLYGATSHKACLIRASNFLCSHKESHQRNAPQRCCPMGKPRAKLQKRGRPDATSMSRQG